MLEKVGHVISSSSPTSTSSTNDEYLSTKSASSPVTSDVNVTREHEVWSEKYSDQKWTIHPGVSTSTELITAKLGSQPVTLTSASTAHHLLLILPMPEVRANSNYTFYVRHQTQPLYIITDEESGSAGTNKSSGEGVTSVLIDGRPLDELRPVRVMLDVDGQHLVALRLNLATGLHRLARPGISSSEVDEDEDDVVNDAINSVTDTSLRLFRLLTASFNGSDRDAITSVMQEEQKKEQGRGADSSSSHHHEHVGAAVTAIVLSLLSAVVLVVVCISGFMASEYYRRYDFRAPENSYSEGTAILLNYLLSIVFTTGHAIVPWEKIKTPGLQYL